MKKVYLSNRKVIPRLFSVCAEALEAAGTNMSVPAVTANAMGTTYEYTCDEGYYLQTTQVRLPVAGKIMNRVLSTYVREGNLTRLFVFNLVQSVICIKTTQKKHFSRWFKMLTF